MGQIKYQAEGLEGLTGEAITLDAAKKEDESIKILINVFIICNC